MSLIDIVRIIVPGIVLGVLIGRIIFEKPRYIKLIQPKNWIDKASKLKKKDWIKLIFFSLLFGLLSNIIIGQLQNIIIPIFGEVITPGENIFYEMAKLWIPLLFITITILPIFEEWIFRGIILEEISQKSKSKILGVIVSAGLFSLLHLTNPGTQPPSLIIYFVGGIILGSTYIVGGLKMAVFTHIFYNVSPFILPILLSLSIY